MSQKASPPSEADGGNTERKEATLRLLMRAIILTFVGSILPPQLIAALENGVSGDFSNSSNLEGRFPQVCS